MADEANSSKTLDGIAPLGCFSALLKRVSNLIQDAYDRPYVERLAVMGFALTRPGRTGPMNFEEAHAWLERVAPASAPSEFERAQDLRDAQDYFEILSERMAPR